MSAGVECELRARDSTGVEHFDIVGVARELGILDFFRLLDELLDPRFLGWIGGAMGIPYEAVVGVLAGVDRAHAIEFAHQDGGKKMVQSEGVVGMAGNDLLEVLNGGVVVEVVIVLEGGLVERIGGTKRIWNCRTRCLAG